MPRKGVNWSRWCSCVAAAALATTLLPLALAQTYPTRPLRLIVPYSAGTGMDVLARTLAEPLSRRLGQAVVVENKPGASGAIGMDFVAKSPPDGYTLMITANSFTIVPSLHGNLPFDPVDDFAAIGEIAVGTLVLVAHPSFGVASVGELVALARAKPGALDYASPGNGTPHHLGMELFKQAARIDIVHVPYKASAGAVSNVLAGQVPMMIMPLSVALPHAATGRLKLLAVFADKRAAQASGVPTFRESGYAAVKVDLWYGLLAPSRTPRDIVNRLHDDVQAVLAEAEIRESLLRQGLLPVNGTPEAFAALIRTDLAKWRKVVTDAKISAD